MEQRERYEATLKKQAVDFRSKILEDSKVPELQIKDFILTQADKDRLIATANR